MEMWRRLVALGVLLGLAACDTDDLCITEPQVAFMVRVYDETTGDRITQFARGVIQRGAYVDSLRRHSWDDLGTQSLRAGESQSGKFEVRVEVDGYQPWVRRDLWVLRSGCGPITRYLDVEMAPLVISSS